MMESVRRCEFPGPNQFAALGLITVLFGNLFNHAAHQLDHQLLKRLRDEDFDVIIDDGSHNTRDQLITFFSLYSGKHYFIEDCHCNDEFFYSQGLPMELAAKKLLRKHYYAATEKIILCSSI